jgi:hypothetical protein
MPGKEKAEAMYRLKYRMGFIAAIIDMMRGIESLMNTDRDCWEGAYACGDELCDPNWKFEDRWKTSYDGFLDQILSQDLEEIQISYTGDAYGYEFDFHIDTKACRSAVKHRVKAGVSYKIQIDCNLTTKDIPKKIDINCDWNAKTQKYDVAYSKKNQRELEILMHRVAMEAGCMIGNLEQLLQQGKE